MAAPKIAPLPVKDNILRQYRASQQVLRDAKRTVPPWSPDVREGLTQGAIVGAALLVAALFLFESAFSWTLLYVLPVSVAAGVITRRYYSLLAHDVPLLGEDAVSHQQLLAAHEAFVKAYERIERYNGFVEGLKHYSVDRGDIRLSPDAARRLASERDSLRRTLADLTAMSADMHVDSRRIPAVSRAQFVGIAASLTQQSE